MRTSGRALLGVILAVGLALPARALPPLEPVTEGLTRFRASTGDVLGRGRLTYEDFREEAVRLERRWGEPPRLVLGGTTLEADWSNADLEVALRLAGAALSAEDLGSAVQAMGRALEPRVETLAFLGDDVVYVLGGALNAPTPHVFVERESYRLRAIDLPMPEGVYHLEMADYRLAEGWFPARITVYRGDVPVFELVLDTVNPL